MRSNLFTRLAPLAAVAAFASTASAQSIAANGVSASAENASDRAPIWTGAAMVAPAKKLGFGLQAYTDRASADEGGVEASASRSAMQASLYYGVSSRLTVGGYLPFNQLSAESSGGPVEFDDSESGIGDAGLFGRFAAFKSASGATHFALGAEVTLPTGDEEKLLGNGDPTYRLDAPLSHRAGRWNLHFVPGVQKVTDLDPYWNLNVAGVYSMTERLGWSVEALSQFGGAISDAEGAEGDRDIDVGSGLRYRLQGKSAIDFGFRYNVSTKLDPAPTRFGAYLGWHMAF